MRLALKVGVQNNGECVNVISARVARSTFYLSQKRDTNIKNTLNVKMFVPGDEWPRDGMFIHLILQQMIVIK